MRLHLKVIAAALAAAIAVSTMPAPAAAQQQQQQQQQQGVGIWPLFAGPIGLAGLVGTGTTTFSTTLTQKLFFHKFNWYKWGKVYDLHKAGYDLKFYKKGHYVKVKGTKTQTHARSNKSTMGKAVVGCIFGSALATIWSAARKGSAMGNPLRWRSQAEHERILASGYEKQFELTLAEANTAMAFCGLGSFALHWPQQR